jgi:arginase
MPRTVSLLGVPSSAGTHGPGQEKAPAALRAAGLVRRLQAAGVRVQDHGDLPTTLLRADPSHRDRQGIERVTEVARQVRDAVTKLLEEETTPLLIGGDCTITLGALAALEHRWPGETGLLYFDGDLDLSVPETTRSGILDTMVLSHVLGEGTEELRSLGPRVPLLPAERIVAFGHDPRELNAAGRERLDRHGLHATPCTELAGLGAEDAGRVADEAVRRLRRHASRVLLHFDVDVIDSTELPLANFPHFNECLSEQSAMAALSRFCAPPGPSAMVVTEINPDRDPDGTLIDRLVDGLVRAVAA